MRPRPRHHIACLLIAATAACASDDPAGWTRARWGMTAADLAAVFPDADRRPPEKDAILAIDSIDLAGARFRVVMYPDAGGGLAEVHLGVTPPEAGTDALFQTVENLLADKYGRPWQSTESDTTTLQWTFPTTTIQLRRLRLRGATRSIVDLIYMKRSQDPI